MRTFRVTFLPTMASKSIVSSRPISSTLYRKSVEMPSSPVNRESSNVSSPSGVVILRRRFAWVKSSAIVSSSRRPGYDSGSDLCVRLEVPAAGHVASRLAVGSDHRVLELDLGVAQPDLLVRHATFALGRSARPHALEQHVGE